MLAQAFADLAPRSRHSLFDRDKRRYGGSALLGHLNRNGFVELDNRRGTQPGAVLDRVDPGGGRITDAGCANGVSG